MTTTRPGYPDTIIVRGVAVSRELFIHLCSAGSLQTAQAMEFWDDCMYDVYVYRMTPQQAYTHLERILRAAIGYQFDVFWASLATGNSVEATDSNMLRRVK